MVKKNSYKQALKKLLLGQFGAAMLGIMTSLPTMTISDDNKYGNLLGIATTVLAVFFFMYLQYTAIWDIAAKDKLAIDGGRMTEDRLFGLKAALLANIPTYAFAVLSIIFKSLYILTDVKAIGEIFNLPYIVNVVWNYMYHGLILLCSPGAEAIKKWITIPYLALFILLTVPSLVTCHIAYGMGLKGKRIFPEKKKD